MATIENALSLTNGSANMFNSINKTINNTLSKTINNTINSTISKTINNVSQRTKNLHFELNLGMKPDGVKDLTKELSGVIESINAVVDGFKKMQSVSGTAIKNANDTTTSAAAAKNKKAGFSEKFSGFTAKARGAAADLWPSVQAGMELTDKYARQNYQLESIAQNGDTSGQLRQEVYSAAQRSRNGYDGTLSTVTKLAKTSKDDFKTNDEVIYFTELLNKAFGGLGAEEAAQGINKVSEAMEKGKLQGEDLSAIMEQSPVLAQALTRYTGQSQEQLAAGPGVSDDVLKNAMYNSAEDINNKFLQMPVTFVQIGTLINDTLTKAFGPLLEAVANAATWIYNNWSTVEPIFWGIAGAIGAVTIAQLAMNLAFLACPLTWIILAIGAVIALIAYWIQSVGGIKVAWLMVVNALIIAWDVVKIAFFTGVYWVLDLWNNMMLGIKSASVGIQNFFGDMKVGVLTILQDMVNGGIDLINLLIGALNHLPNMQINPLEKVTFGQDARKKNDAEKMAREAELTDERRKVAEQERQHQKDIFDKTLKAASDKLERDKEIASLRDEAAQKAKDKDPGKKYNAAAYNGSEASNETNAANLAATAANTGAMKNSMDIAEENLVYMRDIAEREAINKFTTSEISVSMGGITNNVNSELDLDGVVSYMEQKVYETMTVAAEGVHY